jgi:predicted short-subunit dehydrogenase-like oxidoreductase (DUF2520 family)
MISKISIIGKGNVGNYFYQTLIQLKNQNFLLQQLSGRDLSSLFQNSDLYIFALPDDVYIEVLNTLGFKLPFAVHTSGSLSKDILAPYSEKFGIFYPFQTISCENEKEYHSIDFPICIDSNSEDKMELLKNLAHLFTSDIYHLNDKQRHTIHLAAVFASNFSNVLYDISYKILEKENIDWNIMLPLLKETVHKIEKQKPSKTQTGPAKRKDFDVLNTHLIELNGTPYENVYKIMTEYILLNL